MTIDLEPHAKMRPRARMINGRPTFYTPAATKRWEKACAAQISRKCSGAIITEPVVVEVEFIVDRPKSVRRPLPSTKPDIDNYVKSFLDAFESSTVLVNDALVTRIVAWKRYVEPEEHPHVRFRWLDALESAKRDAGLADGERTSDWRRRRDQEGPSGPEGAAVDRGEG